MLKTLILSAAVVQLVMVVVCAGGLAPVWLVFVPTLLLGLALWLYHDRVVFRRLRGRG